MNIVKATRQFEAWLAQRTDIVKKDLHIKHADMKLAVFPFLRATYYRWAQLWPKVCPELAKGPKVLAVGDLHVENFGTWRDVEGRLIWGVNDFDETHPMSYANDLVRLAVSAHLAAEVGHLVLKQKDICDSILEGYRESLRIGGLPFVLGENNDWLRQIAESELRDPVHFWAKMDALPTVKGDTPISATDAIEHLMPAPNLPYRLAHRVAGLGSLGHARYVAIAQWHGARVAREAKALVSSACYWAKDHEGPSEILYQAIITAPCAVSIPSFNCAATGSSAASARTAPASNCPPSAPPAKNYACSAPWDGKLPTSISEQKPPANPSSATCKSKSPDGCTKPRKKCCRQSAKIGRSGRKKATPRLSRRLLEVSAHGET